MFVARVVGEVWSTVKWPDLTGLKLLIVRPYTLDAIERRQAGLESLDSGRAEDRLEPRSSDDLAEGPDVGCLDLVVVADTLDAGRGDDVVVAYGHAARVAVEPDLDDSTPPRRPIDAAIVAIVDRFELAPTDSGSD